MNLISAKRRTALAVMFTGLLGAAWLAGCQSLGPRDMGRLVPDYYRVAIPSTGTHTKTLKTPDMTIEYQYRTAGDQLKVWGAGEIRYTSIDVLTFHLYFLDERGEVINIDDFFSYADHSDFDELNFGKRRFHRDFTVPAGAVAFAIGYDGQTGRDLAVGAISFSYYPFDD